MPIEHMRFICPSECERNQIYDYLNTIISSAAKIQPILNILFR